jgi:F-type H+-transporting ATPase subunit a
MAGVLAATFHPPTTKDFVFDCYFGFDALGVSFCYNFITLLVTISVVALLLLFFLAFRRPAVVPGRLQSLTEMGLGFVREQIALPMLGSDADRFMPLLASLFFFILFMNILEVAPWVNFSANSLVAFPLALAAVSWVTYNAVGISHHGFFGYLKHVLFPPGVPLPLKPLLALIEFVTQIIIRPITLSVRLAANFMAGHFLLAVVFLGTEFFLVNGPKTWLFLGVSFPLAVILVAFEVFVSLLQAFIFAILTASYIGGALAEEH